MITVINDMHGTRHEFDSLVDLQLYLEELYDVQAEVAEQNSAPVAIEPFGGCYTVEAENAKHKEAAELEIASYSIAVGSKINLLYS